MFVELSWGKSQLPHELNMRLDDFDARKHFTPDGVNDLPSPLLPTFNHYVVLIAD